jgi:hypothetical protein
MLARKDALPLTFTQVKYHHSNLSMPDPPYLTEKNDQPIDISVGRQLWIDNYLMDSSTNIKFVHHQAVDVTPQPILEPNSSDERRSNSPLPDAVLYDPIAKEFKMWYILNYEQTPHKLCLATSQDGINWIRPTLNIQFNTFDPCCDACAKYNAKAVKNQNGNIICSFGGCRNMKGRGSGSIIMDLNESDPNKRFKLAWGGFRQIKIYYSPDGINWSSSETDGGWVGGSVWFLSWNPFRKKYIFTMRDNLIYASRGRLARYMEVEEISKGWPKWEDGSGNGSERYTAGQPVQYCISDQNDYHYTSRSPGVYCAHMVAYESIMVNLFSIYHSGDGFNKRMSIYAGYSRDGFHYTRDNEVRNRPLIPEMGSKTYMCAVGGNICVTSDRVLIYYFYKENSGMYTGCATIRRDGWVHIESVDASMESVIMTRLLKISGPECDKFYLFVNMIVSDDGYLKATISDKLDQEIGSGQIKGPIDFCSYQVIELDGKRIFSKEFRIKFEMKGCNFYSFWISPSLNAESNGFVGNGGPMFSSYQDKVAGRVTIDEKTQVFKFPTDETVTVKNMKVMEQFATAKKKKANVVADNVKHVDVNAGISVNASGGTNGVKIVEKSSVVVPSKVVSTGVSYLPDEQIEPVFVSVDQMIRNYSKGREYPVYDSITYDYYDMMVCNRDRQLVKREKVQRLNLPDIIGFSGNSELTYENHNVLTPGSSNFGRMVMVELLNKSGESVNLILLSNTTANAIVNNLKLIY